MSRRSNQPVPDPASNLADSGLRCPQCDYNLTGLAESRCPECGAAFDPEELRRILAGGWAPIPGWDDRGDTNILVAFARVCWATWFHPGEFARRFPLCYDRLSVTAFRWLARAVAIGIFWLTPVVLYVAMGGFPGKARHLAPTILVFYLPIVLATLFASFVCETVLGVILDFAVGWTRLPPHPRSRRSWLGIVSFYSSFLIVTAATAGLAGNVIIALLGVGSRLGNTLLLPLFAVDLLWWWYCLAKAVAIRGSRRRGKWFAIAIIPLVGVAAIALMVGSAVVFGAGFYKVF